MNIIICRHQHLFTQFFAAWMFSRHPANSVKAPKAQISDKALETNYSYLFLFSIFSCIVALAGKAAVDTGQVSHSFSRSVHW